MIIRQWLTKGFVLSELIISMAIITALFILASPVIKQRDHSHLSFYHDYLYHQSLSMVNKETIRFENEYSVINFNEKGNVEQAKTIKVNNHIFVIELGGGRLIRK